MRQMQQAQGKKVVLYFLVCQSGDGKPEQSPEQTAQNAGGSVPSPLLNVPTDGGCFAF